MNREERGALVGMVMGDGCLRVRKRYEAHRKNKTQTLFQLSHSIRQLDYLRHKAKRINQILGGRSKVSFYDTFLAGSDKAYRMCRIVKVNSYFGQLKNWIYPEEKKEINARVLDMITLEGLAYWYLDDGHTKWDWSPHSDRVKSASSTLAVCLPVPQVSALQEYILNKYSVDSHIVTVNNSNMLYFKNKHSHAMRELFRPYTPESMLYKICPMSARRLINTSIENVYKN